MRKLFGLVVLAVVLSSCSPVIDLGNDARNYVKLIGMEIYRGDFSEIEAPAQIGRWIFDNIDYKADDASGEWQTPEETIRTGRGDCEDMAILYINILYVRFGAKASLGLIDDNDPRAVTQIRKGGHYDHAVVVLPDGRKISAQGGAREHEPLKFIYYFDEIFR